MEAFVGAALARKFSADADNRCFRGMRSLRGERGAGSGFGSGGGNCGRSSSLSLSPSSTIATEAGLHLDERDFLVGTFFSDCMASRYSSLVITADA